MAQVGTEHRSHLDPRTQELMAQLDETLRVTAIVVVGDHPQSTQGSYEHWSGVRHPAEAGGLTHQPGDAVGAYPSRQGLIRLLHRLSGWGQVQPGMSSS